MILLLLLRVRVIVVVPITHVRVIVRLQQQQQQRLYCCSQESTRRRCNTAAKLTRGPLTCTVWYFSRACCCTCKRPRRRMRTKKTTRPQRRAEVPVRVSSSPHPFRSALDPFRTDPATYIFLLILIILLCFV